MLPAKWKWWAIGSGGVIAALVGSFIAGRYSRPAKTVETVKVETKVQTVTEWKDRIVYVQSKDTKRHVETRTEKAPGGGVLTVRVEDYSSDTDTKANTEASGSATLHVDQSSTSTKVTETSRPGWSVGVGGMWDPGRLSLKPDRYDLSLGRRVLGTVWLDAKASAASDLTGKQVGLGVRVEF